MKTIYAREYGIRSDMGEDSTALFAAMLKEGTSDTSFILDCGRYDFYSDRAAKREYYLSNTDVIPLRNISVLLKDMKNVVLDGMGSEFVFHGQTIPITVDKCDNVAVKNIIIDWEIPLSAEGTVIFADKTHADISVNEKLFPYTVENGQLYFLGENWKEPVWDWGCTEFDAVTKKVAFRSGDTFPKTTQELLPSGAIRFSGDFSSPSSAGNTVVLRHNSRSHSGVFMTQSKDIILEKLTVHCTGGLGMLAQFCENLSFKGITMIANLARGRKFVCGHDDGLHLCSNSGSILVEDCYFKGLMDDPLNIHGIATRILKKENARLLICEFAHNQAYGFDVWAEAGHDISFIRLCDMESIGVGSAKSFKLIDPKTFEIEFTDDVPSELELGDSLENLTRTAALTCRNNYFGSCRARGILITTPKAVLVENNVFDSAGAAILMAGDACGWYESGNCRDVTIRGNYFGESCQTSMYGGGDAVISLHPSVKQPSIKKPFHRNIRITDNTFQTADYPVLYAYCTKDISFVCNNIIRSYVTEPWNALHTMLTFDCCSGVTVGDNHIIGAVLGQNIGIARMEDDGVTQIGAAMPIVKL